MTHANIAGKIRQIAFLGNHLPRQCGIATFTTDLSGAIATEFSNTDCLVVAMNDPGKQYAYPPRDAFAKQRRRPLQSRVILGIHDARYSGNT
jgi:hypothetical protein